MDVDPVEGAGNDLIEVKGLLPSDVGFIDSLDDPLKSIGRSAIPSTGTPLPAATARADSLELGLRSHLLNNLLLGRQSSAGEVVRDYSANDDRKLANIVHYWRCALDLCLHLDPNFLPSPSLHRSPGPCSILV